MSDPRVERYRLCARSMVVPVGWCCGVRVRGWCWSDAVMVLLVHERAAVTLVFDVLGAWLGLARLPHSG